MQTQLGWVLDGPNAKKVKDAYNIGQTLGKGAFGTVYLATDKITHNAYACKSINKAKLVTEEDVRDIQREVQVLNLVSDHPNVAELVSTYEDAQSVHLILELCRGGELFDRIVARGTFSEKQAAEYFRTMLETVQHLHQLGVMHRDLKPENFLLTSAADDAALKLCDFGLSAFFRPGERMRHIVGSAYYVAPEVLQRNYGVEADVWSLGVLLYILLSGLPPFWGDTDEDIFRMVLKGDVDFKSHPWPTISLAAKDCVRQLLTVDTTKRPTARQILKHPWLVQQGAAPDKPLDSIVLRRMKNFAAMNKLKKAALLVIAKRLTHEEISGLEHLFKTIDADGNGVITVDELRTALYTMDDKIKDTELQTLLEGADVDRSQGIDYAEFIAATINLAKLEQEQNLQAAFREFDADGNGRLTRDEIQRALASMSVSDAELEALIDTFDVNHDGSIDYSEFCAMMRQNNAELQEARSFFRDRTLPI